MSAVEGKCNGKLHRDDFPRITLTYKRRKLPKPSPSLAVPSRFDPSPSTDIGWSHGTMVDGNRLHWQCNWCGMIRYGGGVSRLKRHLVGSMDVRKCPFVPEEVSRMIMNHMLMKRRCRRRKHAHGGIENIKSSPPPDAISIGKEYNHSFVNPELLVANESKVDHWQPNNSTQRSQETSRAYENTAIENLEDLQNAMSDRNANEQDEHATSNCWSHWRRVLENMLHLHDEREGGSVENCISFALACHPHESSTIIKAPYVSEDTENQEVSCLENSDVKLCSPMIAGSDVSRADSQADANVNTTKCKNALVDILRSAKFALLCDLLWRNFQIDKRKSFFDFGVIDARMKNGQYEHSPGLFEQDMQQIWENFQNIGQNMIHLASCLSEVSRFSFQKQVGGAAEFGSGADDPEEPCVGGAKKMNASVSNTPMQPTSRNPDHSTKPGRIEDSGFSRVFTCKHCGLESNTEQSRICDGCRSVYHLSCINPPNASISTRNWYCVACSITQNDCLHQNCTACDRLQVIEKEDKDLLANDSRDSSISRMQPDEPPELSGTSVPCLCKLCGTCEAADRRFLICGHVHCPYMFYHIRCLKSSQIACGAQPDNPCWYCPSCLCQACLSDKDDDKIVLCDRCDEAYHTYCMEPPRSSVPKGQWYCVSCNVMLAAEGMRKYEQLILQIHGQDSVRQASKIYRSMDLLLIAAETLKTKEHPAAIT